MKSNILSGILGTCMGLGVGLYAPSSSPPPVPMLVATAGIVAEKTEPPQPLQVLPQPRPPQKVVKKNVSNKKRTPKPKSSTPLSPTS